MQEDELAIRRLNEVLGWINSDRASTLDGWDDYAWTHARERLPSRVDTTAEPRSHPNGVASVWVETPLGRRRICCAVEGNLVVGLSVRAPEDVREWQTIAPTNFCGDEGAGAQALRFARSSEIPGCIVATSTAGHEAVGTCGYSDLRTLEVTSPHTVFRLSSVTKVFTTIAILRLVETGDLALDMRIADFVAMKALGAVTVEHLLSHTSGLKFDGWVHVAEGEPELRIEDCAITATELPGTQRVYTNQGFALLGRVIERCTARPWDDHIRETILDPLDMSATALSDTAGFPDGYAEEAGAIVPEDRYTPGYGAAAAGWTTAGDLLKLGEAIVHPERGWMTDRTLARVDSAYASVTSDVTQGLGFLRFSGQHGDVLFHTGGWPGWSAAFAIRLSDRSVGVVGANRSVEARSDWPSALLGDH